MAKAKDEKLVRVRVTLLAEILMGDATYRNESLRLKKLGVETGPDLEDTLIALRQQLDVLSPENLDRWLRDKLLNEDLWLALLEVMVHRGDGELLLHLRTHGGEKWLQKAVGAALQRLKNRGIDVETRSPTQARAPASAGVPAQTIEAYMAMSGPEGQNIFMVFISKPTGDVLFEVDYNEHKGISTSRFRDDGVRGLRRNARETHFSGLKFFYQVPPEFMALRVEQAIAYSRQTASPIGIAAFDMLTALRELGCAPALNLPPAFLHAELKTTPASLSREFIKMVAVTLPLLPEDELTRQSNAIIKAAASRLVITQQARFALLDSTLLDACDALITPRIRKQIGWRLENRAMALDLSENSEALSELGGFYKAVLDPAVPAHEFKVFIPMVRLSVGKEVQIIMEEVRQTESETSAPDWLSEIDFFTMPPVPTDSEKQGDSG